MKNRRVIKLTESDLVRIVKRILKEGEDSFSVAEAKKYVDQYLESRGGGTDKREDKDVLEDLLLFKDKVNYAITLQLMDIKRRIPSKIDDEGYIETSPSYKIKKDSFGTPYPIFPL